MKITEELSTSHLGFWPLALHTMEVALQQGYFTQQMSSDIDLPSHIKGKDVNSLGQCIELT